MLRLDNGRSSQKQKKDVFRHLLAPFGFAERGGLATTQTKSAPLNAFPYCLPQGPLQNFSTQETTP